MGDIQSLVVKFYPSQIGAFIESLNLHSKSSSHLTQTPILPQKAFPLMSMPPKETNDRPHWPLLISEGSHQFPRAIAVQSQIIQMLADMNDQ